MVKSARNNLLHSCYNPLFAYIFTDRFYIEDDSFSDIYGAYESFVEKTVTGKFSAERKSGHSAIKEISRDYRRLLQEMAISIASRNDLTYLDSDLAEWRIDENRKRFILPHSEVSTIIDAAAQEWVDDDLRIRLSDQQLRKNVLSCYFFEESSKGWRFRDNNILLFLLAEVLLNDLLAITSSDGSLPLTQMLKRFAKCDVIPIHPVAVRMWLVRLNRLEAEQRKHVDSVLVEAYKNGKFLSAKKKVDDSTKEFRLELYMALALIHIRDSGFSALPDFFRDLEILSKQLMSRDKLAFDVLRCSIRHAGLTDAEWQGHNLSGFNFSDCNFANVRFVRCEMDEIIVSELRGKDVLFELCKPVTLKGTGIGGRFRLDGCPIVAIDLVNPADLVIELTNCGHVSLSIRCHTKRSNSGKIQLSFDGCRNVQKASLIKLDVTKLKIKDSTYHTFDVRGSRVIHRVENSHCESRQGWKTDRKTRLSEDSDSKEGDAAEEEEDEGIE